MSGCLCRGLSAPICTGRGHDALDPGWRSIYKEQQPLMSPIWAREGVCRCTEHIAASKSLRHTARLSGFGSSLHTVGPSSVVTSGYRWIHDWNCRMLMLWERSRGREQLVEDLLRVMLIVAVALAVLAGWLIIETARFETMRWVLDAHRKMKAKFCDGSGGTRDMLGDVDGVLMVTRGVKVKHDLLAL